MMRKAAPSGARRLGPLARSLLVTLSVAAVGCSSSTQSTAGEHAGAGSPAVSGGSAGASSVAGSPGTAGSGGANNGGSSQAGAPSVAGAGGAPAGGNNGGVAGSISGAFAHPGVVVNGPQLAFLKAKIATNAAPWTAALQKAKSDVPPSYLGTVPYASLSYTPQPVPDICCGSNSAPDVGCRNEQFDASAAYTDALIWALTGDEQYAKQSIKILNAYSAVLKTHVPPTMTCGTPAGVSSNTPLQSGWCGSIFSRAAELMRGYAGWLTADVSHFSAMLKSAYLPNISAGAIRENGNWELSMADALVQIGVFTDDKGTFEKGLALWRRRVPAYIYLTSDGATPVMLPDEGANWNGATVYPNGLSQETCRDLGHVQLGYAAMINAAETARIQGVDLYQEQATRIVAGLELLSSYLGGALTPDPGCPYNAKMDMGFPNAAHTKANPMWEIAYNNYATRSGMSLPKTALVVAKIRPTGVDHHMLWETLTHAEVGAVGLP